VTGATAVKNVSIMSFGPRYFVLPAVLLLTWTLLSVPGYMQEPDDIAPPPLKIMSKDEKTKLNAEAEPKSRTNLALDLMNQRLTHAEDLDSKNHFPEMYRELGSFHALMDDTLNYLYGKSGNSKVLRNFKKFEMTLRSFSLRLEVLRRDLPEQYEPYVKSLIKYLQVTREKAIEPFYGNTVVPNIKDQ
jgi:hypothetical protein